MPPTKRQGLVDTFQARPPGKKCVMLCTLCTSHYFCPRCPFALLGCKRAQLPAWWSCASLVCRPACGLDSYVGHVAWQGDPDVVAAVLSITAAGTGLTLTARPTCTQAFVALCLLDLRLIPCASPACNHAEGVGGFVASRHMQRMLVFWQRRLWLSSTPRLPEQLVPWHSHVVTGVAARHRQPRWWCLRSTRGRRASSCRPRRAPEFIAMQG